MRTALLVAVVAAISGCGDLFHVDVPQGLTCSSTGSCPNGQQCVPGEHVCRTPCTQANSGPMQGGQPQTQCTNLGPSNTGWSCDVDLFCRPSCGNSNGSCSGSGCDAGQVCDTTMSICRPACTGGCPPGWGCAALANGNSNPEVCVGCRPLVPAGGFMPPTFAPIASYPGASGEHTIAVAVGNLTGSGHPAVLALDAAQKLYVYPNNGDGTLAPSTAYATGNTPYHVAAVDITGDGKLDVVVAGTPNPSLLPGNGDGTLGAAVLGPAVPATALVAGDFDNDGKPDVAFSGSGTGQLHILSGDGMGGLKTIASYTSPNMQNPSFVHIGAVDFNGDHKLDLWADDDHTGISTFLNPGGSTFVFANNQPMANFGAMRIDVTAFDADGDGQPDLVLLVGGTPMANTSPYQLVVAHNGGAAGFTNSTSPVGLSGATAMAAADFDGDGRIDAAIVNQVTAGNNAVHIVSNYGAGLVYSEVISVPGGPSSIAAADLDGDGKPDLVLGFGGGGVGVLLNRTPSP